MTRPPSVARWVRIWSAAGTGSCSPRTGWRRWTSWPPTRWTSSSPTSSCPGWTGENWLRRGRAGGAWTPIILLTQVNASYERVSALDDGADDYLSKPFDPAELASRIRAVLRRTRGMAQPLTSASRLMAGELVLERTSRRVTLAGREVTLTPKATMLLDYLMTHPGELHTRDDLLASLWGIDFATSTRAVDHRVREIRQALGDDATNPTYIETVPSVGYRFRSEVRA